MNKKLFILPILALMLFCSCSKNTLFEEERTFANSTWFRLQPEHFTVNANNTDDCYNFLFSIAIDTALYSETSLPIMMEIESPDHEKRTLFSTIMLRNKDGQCLGEFDSEGHLCVTQTVRQFYFFNTKGDHSVNISQRTTKYEIHGIHSIKLKLEKVKLEYPE